MEHRLEQLKEQHTAELAKRDERHQALRNRYHAALTLLVDACAGTAPLDIADAHAAVGDEVVRKGWVPAADGTWHPAPYNEVDAEGGLF